MKTLMRLLTGVLLVASVTPVVRASQAVDVETKLRTIVIPKLDISDTAVGEFFNLVSAVVREADPVTEERQKGINIVLDLEAADKEKKISWRGHRKNVQTIMEDACLQADLIWSVRNGIVWVSSPERFRAVIRSRTFAVEPILSPIIKEEGSRAFLERRGVKFPDGASSNFDPGTGRLMVRNTAGNLGLIGGILSSATQQASVGRTARKPRLKGGPFENEDMDHLRGGTRIADDKVLKGKSVGSLTSSYSDDMQVYQEALQKRALTAQQAGLASRYDRIIIPELQLTNTRVKDALKLLEDVAFEYSETSAKGDEDYQTVMRISEEEAAKTVTLSARNMPLMQAVKVILASTNLRYKLQGRSLIVYSPEPDTAEAARQKAKTNAW